MNSAERIIATVNFQPVDRIPVIAQVFGHAARIADVSIADYVSDGETLARCQTDALKRYGYDAVFAVMDMSVETEAAGSSLTYSGDNYPTIRQHALTGTVDFESTPVPDPHRDGRMPELLKAARLLRRDVGAETLVVGCVAGPMTLATQLLGAETALFLAADDPEQFERLLDLAARIAIRFGTAQIEEGVHLPLVFDPSSTPDMIPPAFFREMVLPRLKTIFAELKKAGAVANWYHAAGPTAPILHHYSEAGVDIANFDYCVSPETAMEALPKTCLDGNIKPFSFVSASPAEIADEARKVLRSFSSRGGFILSSGCEIPLESNPENVSALVNAARS